MADWYVSSASYSGYTAFATAHAYSIGDLIVPIAPALKAKWVMRCTTAGTSAGVEPTWPTANNGTVTSNTAVFTNVTGQSTYFWTAAAGDLATLHATGSPRVVAGDRVFLASDHSETQTAGTAYGSTTSNTAGFGVAQFLSVSRAGSTPPVAADLTSGATLTSSGIITIEGLFNCYWSGISFVYTGASSGIGFNSSGTKSHYLKNCLLHLNTSTTGASIYSSASAKITFDNTQVRFGATAQKMWSQAVQAPLDLLWTNTATPIHASGSTPTTLFNTNGEVLLATLRGLDLSAITGTLISNTNSQGHKFLLDSCKIAAAATRYGGTPTQTLDVVEMVNCFDGTNIINERYTPAGTLTTERTITLSSGATDDVGTFSLKLVSTANVDKYTNTFESFWMDVEYTTLAASKTATVEIISSTALNNDEISLDLEYQGTVGSSFASFVNSLPATVLTTGSAVTTSTATWNSSPATPQKQKLQVTFTPQVAGRVRAVVRLGKASATCYINPQIAIT